MYVGQKGGYVEKCRGVDIGPSKVEIDNTRKAEGRESGDGLLEWF